MANTKLWNIEISRNTLSEIFSWCIGNQKGNRIIFTFRTGFSKDTRRTIELFEKRLSKYILARQTVIGWAGTELVEGKARIFVLKFNEEVSKILLRMESNLGSWLLPNLPEDLCIFRDGENHPVFMSVTHEDMAWVISDTPPPVTVKGESRNFDKNLATEMLIFDGDYFTKSQ